MRKKKWPWILCGLITLLVLLFVSRNFVLRGIGNFLIRDEEPQETDYACVLSGGAYDRGLFAAHLYKQHVIKHILCTGGNPAFDLQAWGLNYLESDVTRHRLILLGVDSTDIDVIHAGTSTLEESDILLKYCTDRQIKACAVISSKFHTRRVRSVFKNKLEKQGITIRLFGAPTTTYNENNWWKNEYGLLTVNNEYVKLIYYMLK